MGRPEGVHVAWRACRSSWRFFRDARLVIDAQGVRGRGERRIAKAIQAIAACIDCLMALTASIPHDVGDLMMTDGSSRGAALRRLVDECFGATGIRRMRESDVGRQEIGPAWARSAPAIMTRFLAQAPQRPLDRGLGPSFPLVITGPISSEPSPCHAGAAFGGSGSWQLRGEGRVC
jgi:hypothetical protein